MSKSERTLNAKTDTGSMAMEMNEIGGQVAGAIGCTRVHTAPKRQGALFNYTDLKQLCRLL